MMSDKTLLVIVPGRNVTQDCVFSLLVAKTGEGLASHFCSGAGFAKGDLYSRRQDRIDEWKKRFGEVEVKYIDETDISEDEMIKRNKNWFRLWSIDPNKI